MLKNYLLIMPQSLNPVRFGWWWWGGGEYEGGYPDTSKFTKDNMYLMDLNMRLGKKKKKQDTYLSCMDLSRPPVFKIAVT